MFFDPNELPEDKLDALIDLTMDIFSESLNFISEIGDDMRLVRFIQQACSSYELSVMVDFPHPEWWPEHEMYAEADELEDELAPNTAETEAETDDANTTADTMAAAEPNVADANITYDAANKHGENGDNGEIDEDGELDENQSLENYVELSVVGTPTSNKKLEDDDEDEPNQTVLASILLPISYLDKLGQVTNDQVLSAVELQWLPERNTFDD